MGVYIKGMKMPKNCDVCFMHDSCEYSMPLGKRLTDCPLVEVPPHGRLIDADALCERLKKAMEFKPHLEGAFYAAISFTLTAPTIIEAESYSERELQRDYEASVEYAQHCERYEPTYDPETGAM